MAPSGPPDDAPQPRSGRVGVHSAALHPRPALTWTDWPPRRAPARAAFVAASVIAAGALASLLGRVPGVLLAAVLLAAVADGLLPTRYTLDAEAASARHALGGRRRPWARVGGWRPTFEGYFLRGRGRSRFLRRRGGLWLRCPGREDDVAAFLRAALGGPEPA